MLHPQPRQVLLFGLLAIGALSAGAWAQGPESVSLNLWRMLRDQLTSQREGAAYFQQVHDCEIPLEGRRFEGRVVSQPSARVLVVNVDSPAGDATLKFDRPLKSVSSGSVLYFKGVVDSYVSEPFMLTLNVDEDEDVIGLDSK